MPELKWIAATRVVATPAVLDAVRWPEDAILMRIAPDEAIIFECSLELLADDPDAIVERENGFVGVWLSAERAQEFLERACTWETPRERPVFAQGAVAGIATKLWFESDRVLFMVPAPYGADFEERLAGAS